MSIHAQPQLVTCYLSQQTHVHINGICMLIQAHLGSTSLPFRFDDEVDDV